MSNIVLNFMDKNMTLNKVWFIQLIMGLLLILITIIISNYTFVNFPNLITNFWIFTLIAFLSGILYYFIIIVFLRYSFNKAYFLPESISNYLLTVAVIVTAFPIFFENNRKLGAFISISGLYLTSISLIIISYYDKNQVNNSSLIKNGSKIIFQQNINYPIIGLNNKLKVNIYKEYNLEDKFSIAVLKLENKKITFPFKIERSFKFLNKDDLDMLSNEDQNSPLFILYSIIEKDKNGNLKGNGLKNNLSYVQLKKILSEIDNILPYEIVQIAEGMKLEVTLVTIKFQVIATEFH